MSFLLATKVEFFSAILVQYSCQWRAFTVRNCGNLFDKYCRCL